MCWHEPNAALWHDSPSSTATINAEPHIKLRQRRRWRTAAHTHRPILLDHEAMPSLIPLRRENHLRYAQGPQVTRSISSGRAKIRILEHAQVPSRAYTFEFTLDYILTPDPRYRAFDHEFESNMYNLNARDVKFKVDARVHSQLYNCKRDPI